MLGMPRIDYSAIGTGLPLRVLDGSGSVLGSGAFGEGHYTGNCIVPFEVQLDKEATRYQLVVGDMPPFDFTDAAQKLELVMGPR